MGGLRAQRGRLWPGVRATVEAFLYDEWKTGALSGTTPEAAFFVRRDRTTMTRNDLDNDRLVCRIAVAVVKPAEFVIFRIGQWTAEAGIVRPPHARRPGIQWRELPALIPHAVRRAQRGGFHVGAGNVRES